MGEDRAEEFATRNAVRHEMVVRIVQAKIVAKVDIAG